MSKRLRNAHFCPQKRKTLKFVCLLLHRSVGREATYFSVHCVGVGLHFLLGLPACFWFWNLWARTLWDQLYHQLVMSAAQHCLRHVLISANENDNQSPCFCYFKVENEILSQRQDLHCPHFDFMFWTSCPHHCYLIPDHPADGEDMREVSVSLKRDDVEK